MSHQIHVVIEQLCIISLLSIKLTQLADVIIGNTFLLYKLQVTKHLVCVFVKLCACACVCVCLSVCLCLLYMHHLRV